MMMLRISEDPKWVLHLFEEEAWTAAKSCGAWLSGHMLATRLCALASRIRLSFCLVSLALQNVGIIVVLVGLAQL